MCLHKYQQKHGRDASLADMIKPYIIFFHVCHVTFEFVESLIIMLLQWPGHIEVTNLDVA